MNYLFHLYLADGTEASLLGNLMGDFVKGRLDDTYPEAIRRGIELHRHIDSFAHRNAVVRRSLHRIDPSYGHCRGILVDVFYDHFLAKNWARHAEVPLSVFCRRVYHTLEKHHPGLPPGLRQIVPKMISHNWLESYRDIETIGIVLNRIASRISRPTPLARGIEELYLHYLDLEKDFTLFLPEAVSYAEEQTAKPASSPP
jgi:acyl carrier protein phosphodiesterase